MKIKGIAIWLGIILIAETMAVDFCYAQTGQLNMQKYWHHRDRMVNKFVLVGPDCGMSILSAGRNTKKKTIEWDDATLIMGYYIGMLATEYELLRRDNQNTNETIRELYYAINALNRLDRTAEAYWRHYYNTGVNDEDLVCDPEVRFGDINGFFIRDDISEEFLRNNIDHFGFEGEFGMELDLDCEMGIGNAFSNDPEDENERTECLTSFMTGIRQDVGPWEMSQDQLIQLFMGLALVSKFVGDDIEFEGVLLKQEVINFVGRIMSYIKGNEWIVVNPVTDDCVQGVCWHRKDFRNRCDCGGALANILSKGLVIASCAITTGFGTIDERQTCFEDLNDATVKAFSNVWEKIKLFGAGKKENILGLIPVPELCEKV